MNSAELKAKLGLNVFKETADFHIKIREGMEKEQSLFQMVQLCPAGLYSITDEGKIALSVDGCLECGTCRILCGPEVLDWVYPAGGAGVQFRFG